MAKKSFQKGIDNVFSATVKEVAEDREEGKKEETVEVGEAGKVGKEEKPEKIQRTEAKKTEETEYVAYNLRYPKELQKRIKYFCIEHDGIDMKDVFTQGAIMYINSHK